MNVFKKTLLLSLAHLLSLSYAQKFVSVKQNQFVYKSKAYYFVGTNFWYASYLGLEKNPKKGINRLKKELDFLKDNNVKNIRVLAGVEGAGKINGVNRVEPSYQPEARNFSDENLKGLDILMSEAGKLNIISKLKISSLGKTQSLEKNMLMILL